MVDNSTPMGEGGNAASGKKTVRGPLIPDKKGLSAHLRSGRIAAYTILGAATIGGIGFLAIDEFHDFHFGNSVQKERVHHAPLINPGVKQQPKGSAPVSASTASVKSAVTPEPA
ncbi:MAG: TrbI/VirB10 family protein, partial [Acidithiobacillus sp.]